MGKSQKNDEPFKKKTNAPLHKNTENITTKK